MKKSAVEKLSKASTLNCGRLRDAAERKQDESVLRHIRGKDCVALEVQYHHRCYQEYTRFLKQSSHGNLARNPDDDSYRKFCEDVVENEMIRDGRMFYSTALYRRFSEYLSRHSNTSPSSGQTGFRIKEKLLQDFPKLVFCKLRNRNKGEVVYYEERSIAELIEKGISDVEHPSDEDDDLPSEGMLRFSPYSDTAILFKAAMILSSCIGAVPDFYDSWPPTSSDVSQESASNMVPPMLFNFIAWSIKKSQDISDIFVEVDEKHTAKILAIAQDLIFAHHNGRKLTPKALSLSMAVRQMTGSSTLIRILSGFGHTISHSSTLRYDTALAQLNVHQECQFPRHLTKRDHTILVWDNADFKEESDTSTHVTNGIAVQPNARNECFQPQTVPRTGRKTLDYHPPDIPPFTIGKKSSPNLFTACQNVDVSESAYIPLHREAALKDFHYILLKIRHAHSVPDWTGHNTLVEKCTERKKSNIGYLPVISASPTLYSTVQKIFERSLELAAALELPCITMVFDEAIYCKAQQIRWKNEEFLRKTVIRLGDFHTTIAFCGTIGRLFNESGLQDLMVESGIVGPGTVSGVMSGKYYNGSIRCHKVVHEALERMRFKAFVDSCTDEKRESILNAIDQVEGLSNDQYSNVHANRDLEYIIDEYTQFIEESKSLHPTFAFWSLYIEITGLLMKFLRATRTNDWKLHLAALRSMLPWFFVMDRINYARYGSVYWLEMQALGETHPDIQAQLKVGWTVQRQDRYGFSAIACDQAIEQTVNKESKTKGGIVGVTLNKAAIHRWLLSHPERSALTGICASMSGASDCSRSRKNLDPPAVSKHEEAVNGVIDTITCMANPFDLTLTNLIHVCSGTVVSDEVKNEVLSAKNTGERKLLEFLKTKVICSEPNLYAPIKKTNLKTFSSASLQDKRNKKYEDPLLNARNLFARYAVIAHARSLSMRKVLEYPLGPFPLSIATSSGELVKTSKANFLHILEGIAGDSTEEMLPSNSAIIVDAFALIQSLSNLPPTFGDIASLILHTLMNTAKYHNAKRIDCVMDRYPEESIKNQERSRRATSGFTQIKIIKESQKIPVQWKRYLGSGQNKEEFAVFLVEYWKTLPNEFFGDLTIFATFRNQCIKFSSSSAQLEPLLDCNHEEADTRLLLHAKHASDIGFNSVCICSPDTDVFVLMLSMRGEITSPLFFLTGRADKLRIISIEKVSSCLPNVTGGALLGFHAFTGCDSTSAFYGKGKKKPWLLFNKREYIEAFHNLAVGSDQYAVSKQLGKFVCELYGAPMSKDVNEARYNLFISGCYSSTLLPPNILCLQQHIERSRFQCQIWIHCLERNMEIRDPRTSGWKAQEGLLAVDWGVQAIAPQELLTSASCHCRTGCKKLICSCKKYGVICTPACKCTDCGNKVADDAVDDEPGEELE